MKIRVVFKVDSAAHIGNGHLFRCLTLADALRARGSECHFICRVLPGSMARLVVDKKYRLFSLDNGVETHGSDRSDGSEWLGVSTRRDAEQTGGVLSNLHPVDWLVVDSYSLDAGWHERLRGLVGRVMVIDDLANRPYDCDLLLDQTYGRDPGDYRRWVPRNTSLLMGANYALLRPAFGELRSAARQKRRATTAVKHILIAMGGSDPGNITEKALLGLQQLAPRMPDIRIHVVLGGNAPRLADIKRRVETMESLINVSSDVENMAALMLMADLAIGAAGTSAWERCCLGLPTVLIVGGEDQRRVAEELSARQAVLNLGWHEDVRTECVAEAVARLACDLNSDLKHWRRLCEAAFQVCDGAGVDRVAGVICDEH